MLIAQAGKRQHITLKVPSTHTDTESLFAHTDTHNRYTRKNVLLNDSDILFKVWAIRIIRIN